MQAQSGRGGGERERETVCVNEIENKNLAATDRIVESGVELAGY